MDHKSSLVVLNRASVLLAEADTIQKLHELKGTFLTLADWAERHKLGKDNVRLALGYSLEAERKMGAMLLATERANVARDKKKAESSSVTPVPTLAELGLTKNESAQAQTLAALAREEFEAVKAGKESKARAIKKAKRKKKKAAHARKVKEASEKPKAVSEGPFDLILADPPWRYEHCEADNREIENQYPTATLDDIFKHSPNAKENSILFLWATAPKVEEAISVMNAWGFSYRTCAVWDKQKIGMGYWFRIQHELLLVGVKGKPGATPESERISSIFSEKRGPHSSKPVCVYEWIERAFPGTDKLEMYCRKPRDGWASWGNEV